MAFFDWNKDGYAQRNAFGDDIIFFIIILKTAQITQCQIGMNIFGIQSRKNDFFHFDSSFLLEFSLVIIPQAEKKKKQYEKFRTAHFIYFLLCPDKTAVYTANDTEFCSLRDPTPHTFPSHKEYEVPDLSKPPLLLSGK